VTLPDQFHKCYKNRFRYLSKSSYLQILINHRSNEPEADMTLANFTNVPDKLSISFTKYIKFSCDPDELSISLSK
jgi:hypothetical protein